MNYSVKFDIKKCAELKIPAEALEFWDKGIGNEFLYSKFYYPIIVFTIVCTAFLESLMTLNVQRSP